MTAIKKVRKIYIGGRSLDHYSIMFVFFKNVLFSIKLYLEHFVFFCNTVWFGNQQISKYVGFLSKLAL